MSAHKSFQSVPFKFLLIFTIYVVLELNTQYTVGLKIRVCLSILWYIQYAIELPQAEIEILSFIEL